MAQPPTTEPLSQADVNPLVGKLLAANPARAYRAGLLVGVVVAVSTALLIIQNRQKAHLNWLFWHFQVSLWVVLVVAVAAGALLTPLCAHLWRRSRQRTSARQSAGEQLRRIVGQSAELEAPEPEGSTMPGSADAEVGVSSHPDSEA